MEDKLLEILKLPFRVSTDTRTIEKGDVFFALKGLNFDGHNFLEEAVAKGASRVVVEDPLRVSEALKKKTTVIRVDDALKAYGDLARAYRAVFKIPVIAVTGSCGKTTAKELIAHVLSKRFKVLKNRGTENNLIGVPKTLFQLDVTHEAAVIELGTNRPGEISTLSSIAAPGIAVITQVGASHLEGLGSIEGVKAEKLSVAGFLEPGGILLVNGEDPMLSDTLSSKHRVVKAGFSSETCNLSASSVRCHQKGSEFEIGKIHFETPLLGRHNILNCLFAIAVARSLGIGDASIRERVADFCPPPGRLSPREINNALFLDDSYNANPTSFAAALDTLKEFDGPGRKIVVCGDMLELGNDEERFHRDLGARMAHQFLDLVIAAGPRCRALVDEAVKAGADPKRIRAAKDSIEAGEMLKAFIRPGDRILVKGSRGMKMERIFQCFTTSSTP